MNFLPELKRFLRTHRVIYSVRSYYLPVLGLVDIPGVGRCRRYYISEIRSKSELQEYVHRSGFESVEDWWKKIVGFNKTGPRHLYKVEKEVL